MGTSRFTFASGSNTDFLETLYKQFQSDPESVEASWRQFFEGYEFALRARSDDSPGDERRDDARVEAYINAFRRLGYLSAHLNPLAPKPEIPENMRPEAHGLGGLDPTRTFHPSNFGKGEMTFAEIHSKLLATYCGTVGPDFRDSIDIEAILWLQRAMEECNNRPPLPNELKKRILWKLAEAEGFEHFLQARYLGQKRFSVEGLESLISLFDCFINEAADLGIKEMTIGMAHRGRLNVLTNVLRKPYEKVFLEFEGTQFNAFDIEGDVKYHLGFASEIKTSSGKSVHLYLLPNPSHLEAINAPAEGFTRARQEKVHGEEGIVPILLHGDAAFIGQGVVAEVLNLSQLNNYKTGGTIHIITNNQIGFTTNPTDSRSCAYSSDISKMIRSPVLHVNADDPEAVAWVVRLAVQYRKQFKSDIVIDLVGYRRYGHNETDEPSFTQPLMYKTIDAHPTVFKSYSEKLIAEGVITADEVQAYQRQVKETLNEAHQKVKSKDYVYHPIAVPETYKEIFNYRKPERGEVMSSTVTRISANKLSELAHAITELPENFTPHPKISKLIEHRRKMLDGDGAVDWAFAELLAFASLANEGLPVRLTGQDCKRGTFSSRHAVLFDNKTGEALELLRRKDWAPISVVNSPLSELGCLGFEFGYSVGSPNTLVLWEAQFGDFVNGAQILIDQFLVASEAKWQQTSGLVLLLPHGHEGMGPEHTSARPERFLQSCGNLNIQVCNVTSPAQLFHLLRRQLLRKFRKPLILMEPKSLLRDARMVSATREFTSETFRELLDDTSVPGGEQVEKLLLCTGKIYFDLVSLRSSHSEFKDVPILRLEQMYPFPYEAMTELFQQRYPRLREVVWVQEEPQNMGAWNFVRARIPRASESTIKTAYVGRKNSGSTAEGSSKAHALEQKRILEDAFKRVSSQESK